MAEGKFQANEELLRSFQVGVNPTQDKGETAVEDDEPIAPPPQDPPATQGDTDKDKGEGKEQQKTEDEEPAGDDENPEEETQSKDTKGETGKDKKGGEEEKEEKQQEGEEETESEGTGEGFSLSNMLDQVEALTEQGVLNVDPEKEYDDSEEGFKEIINDTVEQRLETEIGKRFEHLDGEEKRLLDFVKEGGTIRDYFSELQPVDYSSMDLSDENNQEFVVASFYREQGLSEDKIQRRIERMRDNDTLEDEANDLKEQLEQNQEKKKKELQEKRQKEQEEQKKQAEAFWKDIHDNIMNSEEILGIKTTKKERQQFYDYISKPVDKNGYTQSQLDMMDKDGNFDPEKIRAVEFLKFKGFDLSSVEKKGEQKAKIKLKKNLSQHRDKNASSKGTSADKGGKGSGAPKSSKKIPDIYGSNPTVKFGNR